MHLRGNVIYNTWENFWKKAYKSSYFRAQYDETSERTDWSLSERQLFTQSNGRENHAQVIIRGLRAVTDFEYELQMAQTNRVLAPDVDTVFLTTSLEYAYLSSTILKEVAHFGGDLSKFAPAEITDAVIEKIRLTADNK